ncbi:MAG: site-2 protease family protein [Parcubacteria group bacterium]
MILQSLFTNPEFFIIWLLAIVIAITVHEFSHAFASYRLGDHTAKDLGRLTLNPLSHLDPIGSLMLVIVGFGWGKPVPFNPMYLKVRRWGPSIVSLAGPASNILSVVFFGLILKLLYANNLIGSDNLLTLFLVAVIQINLILALFNLIPIPPLDGSKLLYGLISDKYMNLKLMLERNGSFFLIALIVLDMLLPISILGSLFGGLTNFVLKVFT